MCKYVVCIRNNATTVRQKKTTRASCREQTNCWDLPSDSEMLRIRAAIFHTHIHTHTQNQWVVAKLLAWRLTDCSSSIQSSTKWSTSASAISRLVTGCTPMTRSQRHRGRKRDGQRFSFLSQLATLKGIESIRARSTLWIEATTGCRRTTDHSPTWVKIVQIYSCQ